MFWWLDCVTNGFGGCILRRRLLVRERCATISINQYDVLVPVKVGDVISCYTKLLKVGNMSDSDGN